MAETARLMTGDYGTEEWLSSAAAISADVVSLCNQYLAVVEDEKDDIERVRREVNHIAHMLKITKLVQGNTGDPEYIFVTEEERGSFLRCILELQDIQGKLQLGNCQDTQSEDFIRSIEWPFTRTQTYEIVETLQSHGIVFNLVLQTNRT